MKRKKLMVMPVVMALLGASLVGCGTNESTASNNMEQKVKVENVSKTVEVQSNSQENANQDVTEITFWYSWTDKIQENNIALAEKFNETVGKEKGIHVTAEYQGTYDDLHQKLQAAYVAGATPDVTVMEIAAIRTFAENGVLEPLDEYINASGVDISDFHGGLMENSYIDGSCYGLPYLRSTPIFYMNKNLIEEAGLNPDELHTWDDLKEYATTVYKNTGKLGMSMYTYNWLMEAFMIEHGSSVLSDDELNSNMNNDAAKEVVNFFKDLQSTGASKIYLSASSDSIKTDVMNQNAAIWYGSTGDLTYYKAVAEDCGFDLGCCFVPQADQYGVTSGGCNLIMSSSISDSHKNAAWEFINWLTSTEQTITASSNTGYLPSRKSASESDAMKKLYESFPQFKVALDQLAYAKGRPMNPGYAEATKELVDALDAIWVNDADVNTTLDDLVGKMNQLLSE